MVAPDEFSPEPTSDDSTPPASATTPAGDDTTPAPSDDCETQHTVKSGETLHLIVERYDTSVLGIVEFNGLENPRVIYPGMTLCIPNVGSGFEPLPAGS